MKLYCQVCLHIQGMFCGRSYRSVTEWQWQNKKTDNKNKWYIYFNKTQWKTTTQTINLMLIYYIIYIFLFIIAEMYTYTISFGALYALISWQASVSFFSHLSWRSNQSNQPNVTLDSTKNNRARLVHWVITITNTVSTVQESYALRVLCLTFLRDVIIGFNCSIMFSALSSCIV